MSELIQKKKQITFEELCPEWTEIIRKEEGFENVKHYEFYGERKLSRSDVCIVGEAWKGHSSYYWERDSNYCGSCACFSDVFLASQGDKHFEVLKQHFMEHWNVTHV